MLGHAHAPARAFTNVMPHRNINVRPSPSGFTLCQPPLAYAGAADRIPKKLR